MPGIENTASEKFTQSIASSIPSVIFFSIYQGLPRIEATSSDKFRSSRQIMAETMLLGEGRNKEISKAITLEYFVELALKSTLEDIGFKIHLAPQVLEASTKRHRGIDLIISDDQNYVYLGIDVKLRKGRSKLKRDGCGWNRSMLSPYAYLSLGNFTVDTKEKKETSVKEWLDNCAVPNINNSGKIPYIKEFRSYLIERIERSLYGHLHAIDHLHEFKNKEYVDLPSDPDDLEILKEKLAIIHNVFCELRLAK